jgi:hypothetical protein
MIGREEILKAVQAMSQEERTEPLAAIAALPDSGAGSPESPDRDSRVISDDEVMKLTREFAEQHKILLRRLAQ